MAQPAPSSRRISTGGWRKQDFAEGVHPVCRLLVRGNAALTKLVELIQTGQLQLKLQGGSILTAGNRDQQPRGQVLLTRRRNLASDEFDGLLSVGRRKIVGKPSKIHF